MIHSIATRAKRNGIAFDRHELSPLGIDEGAKCWGVWVEGRSFDKHSRLQTEDELFRNESPHLVVSPIHHSLWPTSFSLQVFMQRSRIPRDLDPERNPNAKDPTRWDSFFGLSDALFRCGVNVLFIRTAQIGYDLVCVTATCEFPDLRPVVADLVKKADEAGAALESARSKRGLSNEDFMAAEINSFKARVAAFQQLGCIMIPRLLELECRLLVMDRRRDLLHGATIGAPDPDSRRHSNTAFQIGAQREPGLVELMTGASTTFPPSSADDEYVRALKAAPFVNRKVAAVGENSYFLSYESVRNAVSAQSLLKPAYSGRVIQDDAGFGSEVTRNLYSLTLETLRARRPDTPLMEVIPPSQGGAHDVGLRPRSACAERIVNIPDGPSYELDAYREFFQRQALVPVRVSAMPSLAYARFWALAGAKREQISAGVPGRGTPLEFRYAGGLLRPVGPLPIDRFCRMGRLFAFLNDVSIPDQSPALAEKFGVFGPESGVFANIHEGEALMRLRFARELVERRNYLHLNIQLVTTADRVPIGRGRTSERAGTSQGFLRAISSVLLGKGLRVERFSNRMTDGDANSERTECEVTARAIDDRGATLLDTIAVSGRKANSALGTSWCAEVRTAAGNPPSWMDLTMECTPGFVPRDR